MGSLSLEKVDHLLWLGRYVERCYTTMGFLLHAYDEALDFPDGAWRSQLSELGFDATSGASPIPFFRDSLFNGQNPSSVKFSMSAAFDNAVVLRDVIGTECLAYVQMAVNSIEAAERSDSPLLSMQNVRDDILAFKGCVDEYIGSDTARNLVKSGFTVERMDLYTRLRYRLERLQQEAHRLAGRIDRIGIAYDKEAFNKTIQLVYSPGFPDDFTRERQGELLTALANLFPERSLS